mmetsp:Transcript_29886/g.86880  ORF Transcript_29886/g.86880 Transcript_29886/m.86880 type:complete len:289 (+) Transcript_29886:563-1429(+)
MLLAPLFLRVLARRFSSFCLILRSLSSSRCIFSSASTSTRSMSSMSFANLSRNSPLDADTAARTALSLTSRSLSTTSCKVSMSLSMMSMIFCGSARLTSPSSSTVKRPLCTKAYLNSSMSSPSARASSAILTSSKPISSIHSATALAFRRNCARASSSAAFSARSTFRLRRVCANNSAGACMSSGRGSWSARRGSNSMRTTTFFFFLSSVRASSLPSSISSSSSLLWPSCPPDLSDLSSAWLSDFSLSLSNFSADEATDWPSDPPLPSSEDSDDFEDCFFRAKAPYKW